MTNRTHASRTRSARWLAVAGLMSMALSAQAQSINGMVDTSAAFSPTNQSNDGATYYDAPFNGPFPAASVAVGEFDFAVPTGFAIGSATISGSFGSDTLGSATAEVDRSSAMSRSQAATRPARRRPNPPTWPGRSRSALRSSVR